jgi:mono/diheme cytochrome c family protein
VSWIFTVAALLAALLAACGGSAASEPGPIDVGRDVYGSVCSACHGEVGQGGTGPELGTVAETFPSCNDHLRWVTLGSERWSAEVGDTYGATDKPVVGGMPENGETLTDEEIAAVVVFERVRYGGLELVEAATDCGMETASEAS